jgi:hypothetical protein
VSSAIWSELIAGGATRGGRHHPDGVAAASLHRITLPYSSFCDPPRCPEFERLLEPPLLEPLLPVERRLELPDPPFPRRLELPLLPDRELEPLRFPDDEFFFMM